MGPNSDIGPDGRNDLCWRAQIGAVPRGFEEHDLAAWDAASHELSYLLRGDDVLTALKDQRGSLDLRQVGPVVRCEGHAREGLGDLRIGPAEAVGQFLAQYGPVRISHDGRRHRVGPAHMVVLKEFEKFRDLLFAETTDVVAVVNVPGGRADQYHPTEQARSLQ